MMKMVQSMEIKRKDDGTIEGVTTMGDSVKGKFTDEEKKRQEMKKKYDKKYAVNTVKMSEIVNLALDGEYDEVISQVKELPPKAVGEFIDGIQDKGKDFITYFLMHLSDDQLKTWHWLSSAEREREYIMSIPEQDLTQQDLADLKGTDF